MADCLADRFHQYDVRFFDTSAGLITFLEQHLSETLIISLDHDLEVRSGPNGQLIDCGTGREVADYLAGKSPVCPVVLHSTNSAAVQGMEMALQEKDSE
jgi:hypothetical protein